MFKVKESIELQQSYFSSFGRAKNDIKQTFTSKPYVFVTCGSSMVSVVMGVCDLHQSKSESFIWSIQIIKQANHILLLYYIKIIK